MPNLFYTLEECIESKNSIFLAGPTYRTKQNNPNSWRKDAVKLFEGINVDIFIPEYRNDIQPTEWTYEKQVDWETKMLNKATVILFWIPRSLELPALTTNIEFGEWMHSGKIVCGGPKEALHNRYLITRWEKLGNKWNYLLKECVSEALGWIEESALLISESELTVLKILENHIMVKSKDDTFKIDKIFFEDQNIEPLTLVKLQVFERRNSTRFAKIVPIIPVFSPEQEQKKQEILKILDRISID